ncbi:MAG: aminoacyl-tRNA hydrolase [Rickettsiales bacterium]|nr:MAG: aminoacyl-tRNA hydrolase [Rickettsiales bacterium]
MFLIVGLGNPDLEYLNTRHNAGFMAIDHIAKLYEASWQSKPKFKSQMTQININNIEVVLSKPETYMNLSGMAVQAIASFYKIPISNIIVIHDDIDLAFGRLTYKLDGGTGGHNGLKSLKNTIGTNYHRIRMGIGRPSNSNYDISQFVLEKFLEAELAIINKNIELIAKNIKFLITNEIEKFIKEISF